MKGIVTVLLLITIMVSCKKDDGVVIINENLEGTWNMTSYSIFGPSLPSIEEGDVLWIFDLDNNKLNVVNNLFSDIIPIYDTGEYDIVVTESHITINQLGTSQFSTEYDYSLIGNVLTISDHPELDGPVMKFLQQ